MEEHSWGCDVSEQPREGWEGDGKVNPSSCTPRATCITPGEETGTTAGVMALRQDRRDVPRALQAGSQSTVKGKAWGTFSMKEETNPPSDPILP